MVTRHARTDEGVQFTASLEDEHIELQRCQAAIGTTVRAEASEHTINQIFEVAWTRHWDWYHLMWPSVLRQKQTEDGSWLSLDQEDEYGYYRPVTLPGPNADVLPLACRRLPSKDFEDIHWSYNEDFPALLCNGIKILTGREERKWEYGESNYNEKNYSVTAPAVSVFDRDARLPLNLARDSLTTQSLPFKDSLVEAVYRDLLAHSLVCGPHKHMAGTEILKLCKAAHPGWIKSSYAESPSYVFLEHGFILADPHLLAASNVKKIIVSISFENGRKLPTIRPASGEATFGMRYKGDLFGAYGELEWLGRGIGGANASLNVHVSSRENPLASLPVVGVRAFGRKDWLLKLEHSVGRSFSEDAGCIHEVAGGAFWIIDSQTGLPSVEGSTCWRLAQRKRLDERKEFGLIVEVLLDDKELDKEPSQLAQVWNELIAAPFIPYKQEERVKSLSDAFDKLAPEVAIWREESSSLTSANEQKLNEKRELLSEGGYPHFRHANLIKAYLKSQGISRSVRVAKHKDYLGIFDEPQYGVYVVYSREELKTINPKTPDLGDPFVVDHPREQFPEFERIEDLLKGSNASATILGPERDPDEDLNY